MKREQLLLDLDQLGVLAQKIIQDKMKLIYCAGASASGKSFVAQELVTLLEEQGKKVLLLSSDNYYSNESQLKYVLYGTFDHPNLIDYNHLAEDLRKLFDQGSFNLPVYSFIEKRTLEYIPIQGPYDIVIVEGLYTINALPQRIITEQEEIHAYKIVIHAPGEEIIFRRLLRDILRVKEPLHSLIDVMSNVFPMRNVFGSTQEKISDCIVSNNYSILDTQGRQSYRKKVEKKKLPKSPAYDIYHTHDYMYDDSEDNEGKIIISEVYREKDGLLDHVILQKRSSDPRKDESDYSSISMALYKPGISTEIHTLLQLAGLSYEGSYEKTIYKYNNDEIAPLIYKEKNNIFYQLTLEQ